VLGGPLARGRADAALVDPALVLGASRFVGFTPIQRAWIGAVVERAPRAARDALTHVAPYITFRRGTTGELSEGDHITTFVSSTSVRFLVSLGPRTRATRDALAAHMLTHEPGHAVDNGLIDDDLRASFGVLFSRSPAWASCFPRSRWAARCSGSTPRRSARRRPRAGQAPSEPKPSSDGHTARSHDRRR
jgi:hypothetical protein